MDIIMKKINISQQKNKSNLQITLDDDFNVPDIRPDIDKVVKEQGNINIQDIMPMNDKFMIRGALEFNLLYISQESQRPVHNMSGQIPFEETVNMDGITGDELIMAKWELDDMSVSMINSRKVNIRAIVSFDFSAEDGSEESVATGVEDDDTVACQRERFPIAQIAVSKKDNFRIKDEINLPMGKDNIRELLYTNVELLEAETKVQEDRVNIRGVLRIFALYMGESENHGIEFYETELPINGNVECSGCRDNMVSDITVVLTNKDIQVKPDEDGEERVLDLEAVLNLNIKAYEEEEMEILKDIYSTRNLLDIRRKEAGYKNLLMKNNSKLRVVDTLKLEGGQNGILQICNGSGNVKIDEVTPLENAIQVDGVVSVQVLYITEDDERPIGALRGDIPFSQTIEIAGMKENSIYDIKSCLDQLGMILMDGNEVEVKAAVGLEAIVFDEIKQEVITGVEELESLDELRKTLPSIVGYIVKDGDTLWDVAKNFYTTMDAVRELNGLETDALSQGDKLLICKGA